MYTSIRGKMRKSVKFSNSVKFLDTCFPFIPDPNSKQNACACKKAFQKRWTTLVSKATVIQLWGYNCTKKQSKNIKPVSNTRVTSQLNQCSYFCGIFYLIFLF